MTCLLGCGSVWLLLNTNIIHVCKGQVTYFLTTAIMSKFYPQEDYYFNWRLHKGGNKLYFFPEIKVKHFHRDNVFTFVEHQFRFGIITARVLKFTDLPGHFFVKKPFTLAPFFIPILPFVKFYRTIKRVLIYDPDMAKKRPFLFPMMMIGLLSWGIGFAFGVYEKDTNRKL